MFSDANIKAPNAKFLSSNVHPGFNLFRQSPLIVINLWQPNLLMAMQISLLDNFQMWMFHFMKMYKYLDMYNAICLYMSAYHNLTQKNPSFDNVSQWNL
jgi:hypothetical protein